MTESRLQYLEIQLDKLQRDMYYRNKFTPEDIKNLLSVVNGNKDRLILILVALLIEQNENCGIKPDWRKEKIREILSII